MINLSPLKPGKLYKLKKEFDGLFYYEGEGKRSASSELRKLVQKSIFMFLESEMCDCLKEKGRHCHICLLHFLSPNGKKIMFEVDTGSQYRDSNYFYLNTGRLFEEISAK